jgi:hypothetical protein
MGFAGAGATNGSVGGGGGGGNATAGGTNKGAGGGGGAGNSNFSSAAGGSGFVCIKFPDNYSISVGAGLTSSSATAGGYKTVQFTAGTGYVSFA